MWSRRTRLATDVTSDERAATWWLHGRGGGVDRQTRREKCGCARCDTLCAQRGLHAGGSMKYLYFSRRIHQWEGPRHTVCRSTRLHLKQCAPHCRQHAGGNTCMQGTAPESRARNDNGAAALLLFLLERDAYRGRTRGTLGLNALLFRSSSRACCGRSGASRCRLFRLRLTHF